MLLTTWTFGKLTIIIFLLKLVTTKLLTTLPTILKLKLSFVNNLRSKNLDNTYKRIWLLVISKFKIFIGQIIWPAY